MASPARTKKKRYIRRRRESEKRLDERDIGRGGYRERLEKGKEVDK